MIKVSLDLTGILLAVRTLGQQQTIDQAILGIAESGRDRWVRLAQQGLHTARQAYVQGIQEPRLDRPGVVVLELEGQVPNMLEQGVSAFSLREGMLAKGARIAQDGSHYRPIPMRITGPGTRGAAGQPAQTVYAPPKGSMSGRRRDFAHSSAALAAAVWARAKTLKPGQALGDLGLPLLKPTHTRDPFSGMVRAGGARQRYYVAFRTVSDKIAKWDHPGLAARQFLPQVATHIERIAPRALKLLGRQLLVQNPTPTQGGLDV